MKHYKIFWSMGYSLNKMNCPSLIVSAWDIGDALMQATKIVNNHMAVFFDPEVVATKQIA